MTDMADMLKEQLMLQRESFGKDPTKMLPGERLEFLRWNVLALIDELMEMLQETGWKPWATSNHIDHEAAMKEMVDAWHFFMNIMLVVSGVETSDDPTLDMEALAQWFADQYMAKRKVNADRQADGYTGLDKCPTCKRDRKTTSRRERDGSVEVEYCPCGYVYQDHAS